MIDKISENYSIENGEMMIKFFLVLISVVVVANAKDYCIIAFSSPALKLSDKELFMHRYPHSGSIEKFKNIYEYKIYTKKDFTQTKKILKKVHTKYHDAFIINCKPRKVEKIDIAVPKKNSNKIEKTEVKIIHRTPVKKHEEKKDAVVLKERTLKSKNHLAVDASKVSQFSNVPTLNEPKILNEYEIPKSYKSDKVQFYDNLTYQRYMDALFEHNNKVDEIFYQQKIDSLLVAIKKDTYNFDIYTDGYINTGTSIPAQGGVNVNGGYSGAGVAIHADKLLWNGGYDLINNTYDILNNRLSQITEINAKEKLAVLGTAIYSSLYASQEELKVAKELYKKQQTINSIIKNGSKSGAIPLIASIDSKNDLLELKKTIMRLEQVQQHNDYILRHSIKSKSVKPYKLAAPKIDLNMNSLTEIEKQALANSSDVAIESNKLKLRKADLLFQKRRFYPEFKFNSFLGYGMGTVNTFDLSNPGAGVYWGLGLQFKMPIYNRNDIRLNEEKEKFAIMKQKSIFSAKQREVLIQVDNYYGDIKRINKQSEILHEQYELMERKLLISKEQFINGVTQYREYSDARKNYLNYIQQYMQAQQQYIQSLSILSTIIGRKEFYEQN